MIETPIFPELTFEERNHTYKLYGVLIPSVTTVMRPLSNLYYSGIDSKALAAAANRGTGIHQAIENWLKFGIDDVESAHKGYYQAFKEWWSEKKPTLIGTESKVYHKILRYAGTVDLCCLIDNGVAVCVDFKTSSQIIDMLVRVQLEAYDRAYASHDFQFDAKAIVHLQSNGRWDMRMYPSGDLKAWEVFGGLLTINNYVKEYGR